MPFFSLAQPIANAGADKAVLSTGAPIGNNTSTDTLKAAQIWLNGSLSTGGGFPITSVSWTKVSGPAGAIDTIFKGNQLNAVAYRIVKPGTYSYRLLVTNSNGQSDDDTVVFTASKNPPLILPSPGLTVKQIGCNEYSVNYLTSNNNIYQIQFVGSTKMVGMYGLLGNPRIIGGGQYWGDMCDSNGWAFLLPHNVYYNEATWIPYDSTGALFDSVNYCQSYISTDFFLRNGKLYVYGQDRFSWYGALGTAITKPLAVPMPSGRIYTKITVSEAGVVGLANDSTVWQHKTGNKTPVQITGFPRGAIDICSERKGAHVALVPDAGQPTTSGHPYCWGLVAYMGGGAGTTTTAADYRSVWNIHDGSNNVIPVRSVWATDNTVHPIDTNGHIWGIGLNGGGEVGNGYELCNKADLYKPPYAWNWLNGPFVTPAVDITPVGRTFKRGYGGNAFGFYSYAVDDRDTLWSWGRDKSFECGTLRSMADGGNARPNMLDLLAPFQLSPSPLYRSVVQIPVTIYTCNAGADQNISTTSTTLNGAATPTASYSFVSYQWTQLSGPNTGTFGSPTSLSTTFTGLTIGTYRVKLVATDNNTATIADTLQIVVSAPAPMMARALDPSSIGSTPLSVSPNPSTDHFTLRFSVNKRVGVKAYVTDMNGKVLRDIVTGQLPEGNYTYEVNMSNLPAGLYTLVFIDGSGVRNKKIVHTK